MIARVHNLSRRGISLMEILIGIMVLGIGVISLATLFPIGLLKMKRAVNDVRGTVLARSALSEVRIRNLLAPPFGPDAPYFSGYPSPWPQQNPSLLYPASAYHPTIGQGLPVIIDPLWMIQVQPTSYTDRFGFADFNGDGTADFSAGEGLLRARGGDNPIPPTPFPLELELASEVFSSPDDLAYGDNESRVVPLQGLNTKPTPASLLLPTNGTPFAPGSLLRERRYTWMILARKVNAGQIYYPGSNGVGVPVPDADDVLDNVGPDLSPNTADDPARNMLTGSAEPAPVGPFDVTIIVYYSRDFASRESVYANPGANPALVFTKDSDIVTLQRRADVTFPDMPPGSYVMDTTMDTASALPSLRNGYVYRVTSRSVDPASGDMTLILDQKARSNGYVLTVLKGAVGVFEKQVP